MWGPLLDVDLDELDRLTARMVDGLDGPYLALYGIDPGPQYWGWISEVLPQAEVELWDGAGHYPHLVDPDRFLGRLREFDAGLGAS